MAKICVFPVSVERMAEGAGMKSKVLNDGRVKVTDRNTGALVGVFFNEAEAKSAIAKFVGQNAKDLDGHLPFPARGTPLSTSPLPVQSMLAARVQEADILLRKSVTAAQYGLSVVTPMVRWAQAAENLGKGPMFSKVVETTQRAKGIYREQLNVLRPKFQQIFGKKGTSFQSAARQIQREQINLSPEERHLVTRWNEARTKDELTQPGALLEGGMDAEMIAKADEFSKLGVADEIFEMMRMNAIIDDFLANRQEALDFQIPQLRNSVLEKRLSEDMTPFIDGIAAAAGTDNTPALLMKAAGLTVEQQQGMNILRDIIDKVEFNIPAIYRYATAPTLDKGFKNGLEQYAAKMGMSRQAVSLAKKRREYLIETFDGDAALQDQVLGAQLPVFREAMAAGFMPGSQFAEGATGAMKRWVTPLQHLVVGNEILNRRVLSGLLSPRELDPAVSAIKHARNMLYRKHMDSPIQEAMEVVRAVGKRGDERTAKIMINYLHELEGLPTASFKQLNSMIRSVARSFNIGVEDRVAEKWISTLNFATYSSSIPFRVGLIARNTFQTMLTVPIVGPEAWYHGVKTAMGFGPDGVSRPELMQAAMERAVKAQALKVDVVPLHGGTEFIGGVSEGMFGNARSEFAKVGFKVQDIFEAGFNAYRKPDDIGRVVAFFAGQFRVNKALGNYRKFSGPDAIVQGGKNRGRTALEVLKREGKVKTFDETIEAEFESLIRQDRWQDAEDLIGKSLADKVHFLYADANHPAGWGGVGGKLLGQFGTFPVQYLAHVTESLTRGTVGDRLEFLAAHSAVNLGIISAGATLFDADLTSWAFLPSLTYTGGPYADIILDGIAVMGGGQAERSIALRNLQMKFPSWNRPLSPSIFVPGSYFVNDLVRSFEQDTFLKGVARASGIRFLEGRPSGTETVMNNVNAGFGWLNELNPLP